MHIRVRGIYATALTNLFLSNSFSITQPGAIIARRFSLERCVAPADATVKDREDKKGVVVIGNPQASEAVLNLFREKFDSSIFKEYPYGIYDCFRGRLSGKVGEYWKVEIDGGYGLLEPLSGLREGAVVNVYVKKPFFDRPPILGLGIVVSGKYARLMEHGRLSFSRHIKNKRRREELSTLSMFFRREGWGIRWRSNANFGKLEDLMAELESLKKKALQLSNCSGEDVPSLLCRGDAIVEVIFSLDDKFKLDELRSQIVDTLEGHHYFKSLMDLKTEVFDWIEQVLDCCDRKRVSEKLWKKVHEVEYEKREIIIEHERLNGEIIYLRGVIVGEESGVFKIRRLMTADGVYDGLGVEKKKGDYAITYLAVGSPFLPHFYYSRDGDFKGVYINVNLPIEMKSSNTFWYIDLGVDVVVKSDGEAQIIDLEEIEETRERKIISETYYEKLVKTVGELKEKLQGETNPQRIYSVIESIFRRGGARARSKGADLGSQVEGPR